MSDRNIPTEQQGPRYKFACTAFAGHFGRAPTSDIHDRRWLDGYVAAIEDSPDPDATLTALKETP